MRVTDSGSDRSARHRPGIRAFILLALLTALVGMARAREAGTDREGSSPRGLTVLAPVNLATGLPDTESEGMLTRALARNPHWRVVGREGLRRRIREYGLELDPDQACTEFQCAFDAGNAMQTEFVLFGTATALPEVHTFTLELVHVPTSQVVWVRVGNIPSRFGTGYRQKRDGLVLKGSLQFAVSDLDPSRLDLRKRPSLGLLGVMDAGRTSPHARVALHRALAHAYAARAYDLLGPAELGELMAALDLPRAKAVASRGAAGAPGDASPTGPSAEPGTGGSGNSDVTSPRGDDMFSVGTSMGVRFLLWTKVRPDGPDFRMDLCLYDVPRHKAIRTLSGGDPEEFESLLGAEDRFLDVLGQGAPMADARPAASGSALRTFSKAAAITAAAVAGTTLGFLAYRSKRNADAEYRRFQGAQSEGDAMAARRNVVRRDTDARHFGIMGGLSLALGAAVWAF